MDENNVCINLKTIYNEHPAHVEIIAEDLTHYRGSIKTDTTIEFPYSNKERFTIQIIKTGKSLDIVNKNQKQEIIVDDVLLNNCSLHPNLFGTFNQKNNSYLTDSTIKTNVLNLNGDWHMDIPLFSLKGKSAINRAEFKDTFENSDIACFGCSFTLGWLLKPNESWPSQLSKLLGKKVKNFGIGASNNQEIIATALDYSSKYKVQDIIILLCHFSRVQLENSNGIYNWWPNSKNKELEKPFQDTINNIVNYGESSILFSGQVLDLKEQVKQIKENISGNVYVSSYIPEQYDILKATAKSLNILPMYELLKNYKLASDNKHPGPEHNRQFAENIIQYIND
jgi:hypothetical protein